MLCRKDLSICAVQLTTKTLYALCENRSKHLYWDDEHLTKHSSITHLWLLIDGQRLKTWKEHLDFWNHWKFEMSSIHKWPNSNRGATFAVDAVCGRVSKMSVGCQSDHTLSICSQPTVCLSWWYVEFLQRNYKDSDHHFFNIFFWPSQQPFQCLWQVIELIWGTWSKPAFIEANCEIILGCSHSSCFLKCIQIDMEPLLRISSETTCVLFKLSQTFPWMHDSQKNPTQNCVILEIYNLKCCTLSASLC